jgi:hypothetical protein
MVLGKAFTGLIALPAWQRRPYRPFPKVGNYLLAVRLLIGREKSTVLDFPLFCTRRQAPLLLSFGRLASVFRRDGHPSPQTGISNWGSQLSADIAAVFGIK